ncbi:MAG: hypothetical protein AB8B78_06750 [Polaribacter sp.]
MRQITIKPEDHQNELQDEIVIKISKNQILKFCQFIVFLALMTVNILAIKIDSPFIKELFISQAIILLLLFVKKSKSNTINK